MTERSERVPVVRRTSLLHTHPCLSVAIRCRIATHAPCARCRTHTSPPCPARPTPRRTTHRATQTTTANVPLATSPVVYSFVRPRFPPPPYVVAPHCACVRAAAVPSTRAAEDCVALRRITMQTCRSRAPLVRCPCVCPVDNMSRVMPLAAAAAARANAVADAVANSGRPRPRVVYGTLMYTLGVFEQSNPLLAQQSALSLQLLMVEESQAAAAKGEAAVEAFKADLLAFQAEMARVAAWHCGGRQGPMPSIAPSAKMAGHAARIRSSMAEQRAARKAARKADRMAKAERKAKKQKTGKGEE